MITIINENLKVKRKIIGEIDFSENLLNEVNVSDKKSFPRFKKSFSGKCTIEVYGKEGENIPHFHIISNDKSFECCICIFDNRFFNHGKHQSLLHRKDWKVLDEWMRKEVVHNGETKTNWKITASIWKEINDLNNKLNLDLYDQPDYTIIKPYKEK